jgi:lia operon protein LiaG
MTKRSLAFLLLGAPLPLGAQTVEHRTLPSTAAVYDIAGTVHVVAGTGTDIVVDITRLGPDADRLSIATGQVGDRRALRVLFPSDRIVYPPMPPHTSTEVDVTDDGTWDDNSHRDTHRVRVVSSGQGLRAYADLTVHMPPGGRLSVYVSAGGATASGTDGDLAVDLGQASLTTEHTTGALTLDAGSGDIVVRDAHGDIMLDGGSGDITLNGIHGDRLDVDGGSGDLHATSVAYGRGKLDLGSGATTIAGVAIDDLSLDSGSGDVDLTFVGPSRRVSIDAGSGDVTLHLPKSFAADVEIDAGSGNVRSDFPLVRRQDDETHYNGRIGSGAGQLSIDSGSGTIALLREP